ncbi:MAG TPA: toast rack family protein [Anaerolineales bacterium]|nr:toast rack family protein [Anaerolineales bacterium]
MYKLLTFIAILALTALACGINAPEPPTPSPEVTEEINVDYPDSKEISLKLSFGAGDLTLAPGAERLVEGTATYNYEDFKPEIVEDGGNVEIKMGNVEFPNFPAFDNLKNEWDFKLGAEPMDLRIDAGAYDGTYEFGGLALSNLTIQDGAANVELNFSEPNLTEMSSFRYSTGASDVSMTGLANANFSIFDFASGAGDYTLDFSGELQRDASVKIETGLSNIIIIVPDGVHAIVTVEGGLSNVNAGSGWSRSGDTYEQEGEGPTLTFIIEMGAGNLTLTR